MIGYKKKERHRERRESQRAKVLTYVPKLGSILSSYAEIEIKELTSYLSLIYSINSCPDCLPVISPFLQFVGWTHPRVFVPRVSPFVDHILVAHFTPILAQLVQVVGEGCTGVVKKFGLIFWPAGALVE